MKKCEFYIKGDCIHNKEGLCQKYSFKNDNPGLHCAGFWSKEKIQYLKYYIEMFSTGMKNRWPNIFYIDLFSGPGKCIIREGMQKIDGTCIETIKLKDKFNKYFLIDKNPDCIKSLQLCLKDVKNVEYYSNDCNEVIDKIIKKIPSYSLSVAIIDPDSLQFTFDSYKILAEKKIDLIVNYPLGSMERAVTSVIKKEANSKILEKFHPEWKNLINIGTWGNSNNGIFTKLIKNYIEQIESLGYLSSSAFTPFKNIKNSTIYYIVYFSKDKKGIEFWDKTVSAFKKRKSQQTLF